MQTIIVDVTDSGFEVHFPAGIDPEIQVEVRDYQVTPEDPNLLEEDEDGNEYMPLRFQSELNNPGETGITPGGTR